MHTFSTLPAAEGFRMPAEYEPHRGCVMIWPVRPGSWLYGGRDAQPAFAQAARAIAESETVWMLAGPGRCRCRAGGVCRGREHPCADHRDR